MVQSRILQSSNSVLSEAWGGYTQILAGAQPALAR